MTTEDSLNLANVPQPMKEPVQQYGARLRALAGANARALTLFGSVAAGAFDPRHHTARSVFVVDSIDLEMLRQLAREGPKFGKARIAAPLIMTPEYIAGSADTFPIEFLEIQQHHICVFGDDYFNGLVLKPEDMKQECEREIKTILLGMRQALLATTARNKLLTDVEFDVAERLLRALRGMLWLHGETEPKPALTAVAAAEAQFDRALPGVRSALERGASHGWEEFKALYADVEAAGKQLNAW